MGVLRQDLAATSPESPTESCMARRRLQLTCDVPLARGTVFVCRLREAERPGGVRQPGGSACCHRNRYRNSVTTRLKDSPDRPGGVRQSHRCDARLCTTATGDPQREGTDLGVIPGNACAAEPAGGSACCYWNGYMHGAQCKCVFLKTTRRKDLPSV